MYAGRSALYHAPFNNLRELGWPGRFNRIIDIRNGKDLLGQLVQSPAGKWGSCHLNLHVKQHPKSPGSCSTSEGGSAGESDISSGEGEALEAEENRWEGGEEFWKWYLTVSYQRAGK